MEFSTVEIQFSSVRWNIKISLSWASYRYCSIAIISRKVSYHRCIVIHLLYLHVVWIRVGRHWSKSCQDTQFFVSLCFGFAKPHYRLPQQNCTMCVKNIFLSMLVDTQKLRLLGALFFLEVWYWNWIMTYLSYYSFANYHNSAFLLEISFQIVCLRYWYFYAYIFISRVLKASSKWNSVIPSGKV